MKTSRRLKVYSTPNGTTSRIILQGKWLSQFGFTIGDYIQIESLGNQLLITKTNPPTPEEQVPIKTTVSKQQLELVKERAATYHIAPNEVIDKALHYYFTRKRGL